MTRFSSLAASALATVCLLSGSGLEAAGLPKAVSAAVDDSARPQGDKDRDAVRKPGETIVFAGVKPGSKIMELFPNAGYYTRILSVAVGPKGHVYAVSPPKRGDRDLGAATQALAADPHYSNVTALSQAFAEISIPEPVDVVWTSLNYHDLHNSPNLDIAAFNKAMFNLLKPGGTYLVVDHAAEAGSGIRDTQKLHRIDPAAVKAEVTAAGFKFEKQGDFLKNPDDPHTAPIFDPSIRGKTDQFAMKFTRPK
jgi:predicted methyltransferase